MTSSPHDLAEALVFLETCPCHLVEDDRIQLPSGLPHDQVLKAKSMKAALLEILLEARNDEAQERAGILEFEAGFTRQEAELRAGIGPPAALTRPAQKTNP